MSYYERRGGHRRRHRDDYEDRRREYHESPDDVLRKAVIKFGDIEPLEELPNLIEQIRNHSPTNVPHLAESFRLAVTEQPFKIPYYVALLQVLHEREKEVEQPELSLSQGRQILEDYWKGFQAYLDKLAWREVRFSIHFFAHVTIAGLISAPTMSSLLQSVSSVLDEPGVSHARAKQAAACAAEGLMICGSVMPSAIIDEIIGAIEGFKDGMGGARWMVSPVVRSLVDTEGDSGVYELFATLLSTLRTLANSSFSETKICYPQPYLVYSARPATQPGFEAFDLPSVLVPPEAIELDGGLPLDADGAVAVEATSGGVQGKNEEWPEAYVRLFDDDVTPDPATPRGYAIRSALLSILEVFEINRKECARVLFEYPKWCLPGIFKPRPGEVTAGGENGMSVDDDISNEIGRHEWQLESTILETISTILLALPTPPHKAAYYFALITELCKLSPTTAGPAVGKCIRRLFALVGGEDGGGADVEVRRRFAEWFAVHMSNFGFGWVWKEWISDLSLSPAHPKRSFMRAAVELEVRLSYHERVLKTLPPAMQDPVAKVINEKAPGPDFSYDDVANPHHEVAQTIVNLLRGRTKADAVLTELEVLRSTLLESETGNADAADTIVRDIAVQSLLHIGSRSFSHLLNAIERYMPVLRSAAGMSPGPGAGSIGQDLGAEGSLGLGIGGGERGKQEDAKMAVLGSAAKFWRWSPQMVGIVFDKFMQYQIVDPSDVVGWVFSRGKRKAGGKGAILEYSVVELHPEIGSAATDDYNYGGENGFGLSAWEWELVRGALDKANGRVASARRKVEALRREEDDTRAREKAAGAGGVDGSVLTMGMDLDGDTGGVVEKSGETETVSSPALATALKALSILTREQRVALSRVLEGFKECLLPKSDNLAVKNGAEKDVFSAKAWAERSSWGVEEWGTWETWGWYKHWCRLYAPYLRNYQTTLWMVTFAKYEGSKDPAVQLMKRMWNVVIGQE